MNEKDLNIEYICKKTLLSKGDELVPIILDLIQESYKAGLCQAEFDNTMNLIEETQELKKKYVNAVADYETTMFEKVQLNRLVNSCQEEIRQLKKQLEENKNPLKGVFAQVNDDTLLRDCGFMQSEINGYKIQQKEFIKWLEDKIKFSVKPTSRVLLKSILANYKEITGVSDENNNE